MGQFSWIYSDTNNQLIDKAGRYIFTRAKAISEEIRQDNP